MSRKWNTTRNGKKRWQGMNWIRPDLRLALYMRDGFCCLWCGRGIEDGIRLSLDHIQPASKGGSDGPHNLVTACTRCNNRRNEQSAGAFALRMERESGGRILADSFINEIADRIARPFDRAAAKAIIESRRPAKRLAFCEADANAPF